MRNLLIFSIVIFIRSVFGQTFVIFENNKKNKSLFDYNDPFSLVNVLLQNKSFIEHNTDYGVTSDAIHPTNNMMCYRMPGPVWEINRTNSMDTYILSRNSENESFEDWYLRLTTLGDSVSFDPVDYEVLKFQPIDDLKKAYNNAKVNQALKIKPTEYFYDLRHVNLILMDSSTVYFAEKSPYDNKHFISFRMPKEHLFNLLAADINGWQSDFRFRFLLNGKNKKVLIDKLRELQLTNKELDDYETKNNFNEMSESTFNSDLFEFDFYEGTSFDHYKFNDNVISKKIPGGYWSFLNQQYGEFISLMRNSDSESFDEWYNRLTTIGDSVALDPLMYEDLIFESRENMKKQYEKCRAYDFLKRPDSESVYWVDYLEPMVYINCNILKDSSCKNLALDPYQILFSERIDYKKGSNFKPLILMSFGNEETGLSESINSLLSSELSSYKKSIGLQWLDILRSEKGKKVTSDELKKMIHSLNIDSNGIEY